MASELGDEPARQPRFAVVVRTGRTVQQLLQRGPVVRGLLQAVGDQLAQPLRQPLQVRFLLCDAVHDRVHTAVGRAEGLTAGRRVGEHRAEAEDIAGRGDPLAAHLLGRHETGRPDDGAAAGEDAVGDGLQRPRDAEVDDARTVDGDQDVGGFEVAVDQTGVVDVAQGLCEAVGEDADGPLGQAARLGDDRVQGGTGDIAGGDPWSGGLGVGVQHRRGPRAPDPLRGPHLLFEPPPEFGLLGELGLDELHRHRTAARRMSQEHPAHATRAKAPEQPVLTDPSRVLGPQVFHASIAPSP
ncbi:hypothetical protein SSPO_048670 [Streptomyces antimycoticus]|uniref:Uncharacterized protein n=1 Tax=Streptomyces antimycoticus TaxID=68175 RepID=A0A499UZL7_9ACTN|nr:hypothetical protein SSPO_048670 [Streptomyces antimycoticus]